MYRATRQRHGIPVVKRYASGAVTVHMVQITSIMWLKSVISKCKSSVQELRNPDLGRLYRIQVEKNITSTLGILTNVMRSIEFVFDSCATISRPLLQSRLLLSMTLAINEYDIKVTLPSRDPKRHALHVYIAFTA